MTHWSTISQVRAAFNSARMDDVAHYLAAAVYCLAPEPRANAQKGVTFEHRVGVRSVRASHPDEGVWAARIEEPAWRIEIVCLTTDEEGQLLLRIQVRGIVGEDLQHILLFLRRRLASLSAEVTPLRLAGGVLGVPVHVTDTAGVESLEKFLLSSLRSLPVLLISETDPYRRGIEVGHPRFFLDPLATASDYSDAFHVFTIDYDLAYELTDRLTKQWSCFLGAIRFYLPQLDIVRDDPWNHPLYLPERITPQLLEEQARRARKATSNWPDADFWLTDFIEQPSQSRTHHTPLPIRAEEPPQEQPAPAPPGDAQAFDLRLVRLEAEIERLQAIIRRLEEHVGSNLNSVTIPDSLAALPDWLAENYAGKVVLASRARRGARDSTYKDPPLVYRCIQFLATTYRDARLAEDSMKEEFDEELAKLGVQLTRSINPSRAGEQQDDYFVQWPPDSRGRRCFLEWHLKKGDNRSEANCLRIYFFWDNQRQQVVIGWLTSHLDIRST
ncbi:MAG: hypothetical protein PWP23_1258 [Candidatus Sumerlaeota bacterium]|nr:hypothetical protein [Candidatus Sumerlaeota bacterium]